MPTLVLVFVSLAFMVTYFFCAPLPWLLVLCGLSLVFWGQRRADRRNADGGPRPMASYADAAKGGSERYTGPQKYTHRAPTYMGLLGLLLGVVLGLWLHENFMSSFWAITTGPWYTNALANNPSGTYGDAGAISWSESSMIDTTKAVGYQFQRTYCAAPVLTGLDTAPDQTKVNYWVVGIDCCGPRRSFWCDEAGNPETRWTIQEPSFSWLSRHDRAGYELAIRQAESFFDLTSDPDRLLLRWVEKPEKVQLYLIGWAFLALCIVAVAFLFFGLIASLAITMTPGTAKDPADQQP